MIPREEALSVLVKNFGPDDAYKVLEYFDARIRDDVATQKDIFDVKLEIEKVRAEIEKVRAEIEKVRAEAGHVRIEVERLRADLQKDLGKLRGEWIKWSFVFWISQMAILAGILFKLLG